MLTHCLTGFYHICSIICETPQIFMSVALVRSTKTGIPLMKTVSLLCKLIPF